MGRHRTGGILAAALVGLGLLASVDGVAAHGVTGSRFDAPLPLGFLFVGAGATVALTAAWLAVSGRAETDRDPQGRSFAVPPWFARTVVAVARGGFLLAFLLSLAVGLTGPPSPAENLATVFVWPVWLEGVVLLAALVGSPWRVLSPWWTVYDGLRAIEGDDLAVLGGYPARLGEWPALLGVVVWLGILENLTTVPESPAATTLLVAGYAAVMVAGAVAFGEAWLERADALAVLYGLFGRVAPLAVERTASGGATVTLRAPWRGASTPVGGHALVGIAVAAVYTVSFDGFSATRTYRDVLAALGGSGEPGLAVGVAAYLVGLAGFWVAFVGVVAVADRLGGLGDEGAAARAFAPTVLPIAVAYEVAHNYPYIARNVGQLPVALSDPFGLALAPVDPLAWLTVPDFWASQVVLVVLGHVVAVVAAHRVAVGRYPDRRLAARAHAPLTALMVAYTVLSLWIVSRPLVI